MERNQLETNKLWAKVTEIEERQYYTQGKRRHQWFVRKTKENAVYDKCVKISYHCS
jgi:hypothetical protein